MGGPGVPRPRIQLSPAHGDYKKNQKSPASSGRIFSFRALLDEEVHLLNEGTEEKVQTEGFGFIGPAVAAELDAIDAFGVHEDVERCAHIYVKGDEGAKS